MKWTRIFYLGLFLFLLSSWHLADGGKTLSDRKYLIVTGESSIKILGQANITDYQCEISNHKWGDTLFISKFNDSLCTFSKNRLSIPVLSFDCDNSMMTDDFRETLNAQKFPEIKLEVIELLFNCSGTSHTLLKGTLSIAGVQKEIEVNCTEKRTSDRIIIQGSKELHFADFELTPPEKFFGMVKVKDALTIHFYLNLQ